MYNPLDYPFLDYKGIIAALGNICSKDKAHAIIDELESAVDGDGNPLIDESKIPPFGKRVVPTEIFCKHYKIKRRKKKVEQERK
ncbi:hypothetical protein MKC73_19040 [[Clostridium] innocuum]|nr:hypothetical protein [[Clostridium] innocuum]